MKKTLSIISITAFVLTLFSGIAFAEKKPLIVHVGGTMKPVMGRLAEIYTKKTGQTIEINKAGSGELLAQIEMNKVGDLYVCHDPFLDILMKKAKMGVDGWTISQLLPCIIVQKGNPKNIQGLKDLARPDVDVWLTDYKHSTLGRMLSTIFRKAGIDFKKLNRDKTIHTNKSGSYVANMVTMKNADAAMVWVAVGALRTDSVDIIPINQKHLPTPGVDAISGATGKFYDLMPVRVTIATLKCAAQPKEADAFAQFLISDKAKPIFVKYGYEIKGIKQNYKNGIEL